MKKVTTILTILVLMLMACPKVKAQHIRFEFGTNYAVDLSSFESSQSGMGAYGTLHLMIPFSPISVGTTVSYNNYTIHEDVHGGVVNLDAEGLAIYPHATYTFRGCKYFVPYFGLGAGVSLDNTQGGVLDDDAERNFALVPMLGVRFVNHITLSAKFVALPNDYSRLSLNVGLIF